jgi:hypothetical protein
VKKHTAVSGPVPIEQRYTEEDIRRISTLLGSVDDGAWSNIPRLYIVIRRIGLLELRDHFISKRIADANFPLSDSSFPSIMGPSQRSAFLQMQRCVLTDATQACKCEWGEHAHFSDPEQIPFRMETILGTGGFAQVEKAVSTNNLQAVCKEAVPLEGIWTLPGQSSGLCE